MSQMREQDKMPEKQLNEIEMKPSLYQNKNSE